MEKQNSIWIELDKKQNDEERTIQCGKANKVLEKLGMNLQDGKCGFKVNKLEKKRTDYIYVRSGPIITELGENGQWFDLDYLSE